MRYFATYLIYVAVIARAIGWNQETAPIPPFIWVVLTIFGVFLFSQQAISQRFPLYPRLYTVIQSLLVISMLYRAPTIDFLTLLFLPLSFQAVQFFPKWVGFAWIGCFILSMAGMIFFGLEWAAGLTTMTAGGAANLLMGSFALLIDRTEQGRQQNQRMFADLQEAYRHLKDSAAQTEALAAAVERNRLVRELHDSLTQTLFSMNLAVQSAQLSAGEDTRQADEHLARLQILARNASTEVQALRGQIPNRGIRANLAESLSELAEERLVMDSLQVKVEVTGQRDLPGLVQANLYRIVQEALNNVTRHAGVQQAIVRLDFEAPVASLDIVDDGCGFTLAEADQMKGFGLASMRERATEAGWKLQVTSQPGQGTHIHVEEVAG